MQITRRAAVGGLSLAMLGRSAWASPRPMTYLFPAPSSLPAFIPFHVARKRGYFETNNLAVTVQTARGGVDVAKQVGAGNADFGNALGDTPIIVRPNGIPVRAVALLAPARSRSPKGARPVPRPRNPARHRVPQRCGARDLHSRRAGGS